MDFQRDWQEIRKTLPVLRAEDTRGIVAVVTEDGRKTLEGAIIYDNFTHTMATCHIMMREGMVDKRTFLLASKELFFEKWNMKAAALTVRGSNRPALELAKSIGAKEMFVVDQGFNEEVDIHYLLLRKEDIAE